ncbi:unnamed protein product [Chrysoparadoxa australica]
MWKALSSAGGVRKYTRDQTILNEGFRREGDAWEDSRGIYLILEGTARLELKGREIGLYGAGQFAGESSFLADRDAPRTATLRVITDNLVAMRWTSAGLREFLDAKGNEACAAAIFKNWSLGMSNKLQDTMQKYVVLGGPAQTTTDAARDYGFEVLQAERDFEAATPRNGIQLALWSFAREYTSLRRSVRFDEFKEQAEENWFFKGWSQLDKWLDNKVLPRLKPSEAATLEDYNKEVADQVKEQRALLATLTLDQRQLKAREKMRMSYIHDLVESSSRAGVSIAATIRQTETPWFVLGPYYALCELLDLWFKGRPLQRFWLLETVARMPYFSYLSMLQLYETLGWWSVGSDLKRIHFAEEQNETIHLQIMESLGGCSRWSDRFVARHSALVYYFLLCLGYFFRPTLAYNFSELIESHAVDTYGLFLEENEAVLKALPPPPAAVNYYMSETSMYLFDAFQTSKPAYTRRPTIRTLYDVFQQILTDESEHVKTMFAAEHETEPIVDSYSLAQKQIEI